MVRFLELQLKYSSISVVLVIIGINMVQEKSIDWCIKKILGYCLLFVSSEVFHFISHKEIWVTLAYQGIEN